MIVYIGLTYEGISGNYIRQLNNWYLDIEWGICVMMAILHALKIFIQAHRMLYIFSVESILALYCILPVLLFEDKTMLHTFYVVLATARYLRLAFMIQEFFIHFSPGNSDVEKQSNVIGANFILIIIVSSGFFAEIENS